MTIEQAVLENLRELPTDKQQEVLDFIKFLKHKLPPNKPRPSFYGLWSDLDINITEQDITEIRQEMWANFPRDIEL
ncbi:DUF2281 domain-containing protein [Anabaena sp. PCC 7108]|uniref:DUF2281 domain-containing protein n=1 Tax=Anabaena sp. PCC 7108 TaxID=163908 RepID=UPI00034B6907|nr:DUF2281 domain-containing protein [Anabaena sp. PCC 7108]